MFRLRSFALLLLVYIHAVSGAMSLPLAQDLYGKTAPARQEICTECYEFESQSVCERWQYASINRALRLPGQYEDNETGLHYNYRRYYDPETGRYLTQDPIGLEGGINLFSYAQADPVNLTDPTGEIVPVVVAGAVCMASCIAATAAEDLITGECTTVGTSAKNCAIGCAMGGVGALAMKVGKWGKRLYDNLPCAINSFPADTLVHIQPADLAETDSNPDQAAAQGKSQLIPISRLQPGDKVLALSEWKDAGNQAGQDQRLTYEKVTDVFTSYREQTHIYLTLDNGQTIQATEGHPFLTTEGWRDAILLKRGGKLLIKGDADAADAADRQTTQEALNKAIYKPNQPVAGIEPAQSAIESIVKTSSEAAYRTILEIRTERQTVQVFNIEVANAHTFFVGEEGLLVHNCLKRPYIRKWVRDAVDAVSKKTKDGRYIDPNTRKPFDGKPDLGHKPGHEHWREAKKAETDGLTQKQFNDRMNDPSKYHYENPSTNRGHRFEAPR